MEPSSRPLLLVCTKKAVCNLLSHTPCGKHVVVQGKKSGRNWIDTGWHWIHIVWHNTGMLQHCHLTHPHANTWPCILTSIHLWIFELTCLINACNMTFIEMLINMPWNYLMQTMPRHSSYQKFKHACLVRSSRSLARWSSRFRHLLRYLRYTEIHALS